SSGDGATMGALAVDTLGRIVSWSVVIPFDAGVIALVYMDRRMRREGFDLDLRTRGRSAAAVAAAERGDGRTDGGDAEDADGFAALWRTGPVQARPWTGGGS